ncbi:hypothetical protein [Salinarimonas chemoclinalis]|uniref:hypothetical protein n=1 Tax=Salinarimonas chemoclinalis TaxID=3241599 RepID=UPI0035584EAD
MTTMHIETAPVARADAPTHPTLEALLAGAARRLSLAPSFVHARLDGPLHAPLAAVHTLGPDRTSSHLATVDLLETAGLDVEIVLHDRFEDILDTAERRLHPATEARLAIVPSAFAGASAFFMSARTRLVGCFCHDTPPYHLAWPASRPDPLREGAAVRVATHPAPVGLLDRLMRRGVRWEVAPYVSTVAAAGAALAGEADVALCNLETIRARRMAHDPRGVPIAMSWNLFLFRPEDAA